jgi:hypothetical protein
LAIAAKASVIIGISKAAKGADEAAEIAKMADKAIEFSESANNALKAGENTIGFAKGAGVLAFANKSRSQHAARHLTDAGILPNWSNATFEKFKDIGIQIVENPLKTFDHTLGQTAVKGFHGKVDDKNVVMFIYKEGPYVAQIATSIVPSPQQIINWGLK